MSALTLSHRRKAERATTSLALLPSLGTASRVWDPLLRAVQSLDDVDVYLFDLPGHGLAHPSTGFDMAALARGTAIEIDHHLRTRSLLMAGVSMGGAIAIEIAAQRGDMVTGVITFNSALSFGTPAGWNFLMEKARRARTPAHDEQSTRAGWFTAPFAEAFPSTVEQLLADLRSVELESYLACCRALADYDGAAAADNLNVPTVAVGGAADLATPARGMRELSDRVRNACYLELPGAHMAIVENARAAAAIVDQMLAKVRGISERAA